MVSQNPATGGRPIGLKSLPVTTTLEKLRVLRKAEPEVSTAFTIQLYSNR